MHVCLPVYQLIDKANKFIDYCLWSAHEFTCDVTSFVTQKISCICVSMFNCEILMKYEYSDWGQIRIFVMGLDNEVICLALLPVYLTVLLEWSKSDDVINEYVCITCTVVQLRLV